MSKFLKTLIRKIFILRKYMENLMKFLKNDFGKRKETYYAWFTFSSRQHETRRERECKRYIRLVFHTLNLFSSRLEALGDMSVNQSRVKRKWECLECLALLSMILAQKCEYLHSCVLHLVHILPKSRRVPETRM